MTAIVREEARAKINLALHVTGQRADGYHLLETLVTFAEHGDRLSFALAPIDSFDMSGRFCRSLTIKDNLVLKARDALRAALQEAGIAAPPVAIHLEKDLPVASGIGGGSADAAATLRGLSRLWEGVLPAERLDRLALDLGADVPMCLRSMPLTARGIGEDIERLTDLPAFAMVMANPLKTLSTPEIFRGLARKDHPPLVIDRAFEWSSILAAARNDLEKPARSRLPDIGMMSEMLAEQGAWLVRMSGSGATCFGLFHSMREAREAEERLHAARPDWYFQATETIAGSR